MKFVLMVEPEYTSVEMLVSQPQQKSHSRLGLLLIFIQSLLLALPPGLKMLIFLEAGS